MTTCAVVGCNNRTNRDKDFTYYKFPIDTGLKRAWVIAMRRKDWTPGKTSVVCSKHFEEDCFSKDKIDGQKPKLVQGAVPTIFPTHIAVYDVLKAQDDEVDDSIKDDGSVECIKGSEPAEEWCNTPENTVECHDESDSSAECYDDSDNEDCIECDETASENSNMFGNSVQPFDVFKPGIEIIDEANNDKNSTGDYFETATNLNDNTIESITQSDNTVESRRGTAYVLEATENEPSLVYRILSNDSTELLKEKLKNVVKENKKCKQTIRTLQQKSLRLTKKISELEKFINSHRENVVSEAYYQEIIKSIPLLDNEIINLQLAQEALPALGHLSSDYTKF